MKNDMMYRIMKKEGAKSDLETKNTVFLCAQRYRVKITGKHIYTSQKIFLLYHSSGTLNPGCLFLMRFQRSEVSK